MEYVGINSTIGLGFHINTSGTGGDSYTGMSHTGHMDKPSVASFVWWHSF